MDLGANNTANGCNIFSVNGGGVGIYVTPPCQPAPQGGPAQLGFNFFAGNTGGGPLTTAPEGERVGIQTTAPAGIAIVGAISSPAEITNINNGNGWGGGAYWAGGGRQWRTGDPSEGDGPFFSNYWGWQMVCGSSSGCNQNAGIALNSVLLTAAEGQGPNLGATGANNLVSQTSRYVWNAVGQPYPIPVSTSDPSGVCRIDAIVNGTVIPGPTGSPDTSQWHQCPDASWTVGGGASVDTRAYVPGAGTLTLQLQATNAAQVTTTDTATLKVDNEPVELSLSGPADVASATGSTQYVTTNVTAGPSGVAGARCAVDGGARGVLPGCHRADAGVRASAPSRHMHRGEQRGRPRRPAGHIGAADLRHDASASRRRRRSPSPTSPTHCAAARVTERINRPGRWHTSVATARRSGCGAQARRAPTSAQMPCPDQVTTVRVVLKRHGKPVLRHGKPVYVKRRVRRIVLLPHAVNKPTRRIGHGKSTTVSGFVVLADGTALGGQPVRRVLVA